ncbi:MAG: adenylate/guanylate cyclase domain-containing protein [Acidimicrobiia bacterium]
MDAADYEAAGLYDPAAPDAVERLALLEHLAAEGVDLEGMQRASAVGSLHAAGSDAAIRPGPRRTIEEVAAAAGLTVDLLRRVVLAAGLSTADDDFRESDTQTFRLFAIGAELFGPEPTLRFTRAMGSALASVADAAVSLFLVSVEDPMLRQGTEQVERAKATESAVDALIEIPNVMDGLFRGHVELAIRRQRASTDYEAGPGAFRLAIGFVDLVGYTSLSRDLAPLQLVELVEQFEMTASEVVTRGGGRLVKHIGDEVMFAATDAVAGARIAQELVRSFDGTAGVSPHAGVSFGPVLGRGGDFYGPNVNLASRIADIAVPDEILVTVEVARAVDGADGIVVVPAGRRMLKGFDEPVELWSLS